MKPSIRSKFNVVSASLLLLVLAAGCQQHDKPAKVDGTEFPGDDVLRGPERFAKVQMASAARADATLQPHHFNGTNLNSLGESKLASMICDDDPCEPLVVYLNFPNGDAADDAALDQRQKSVTRYLVDSGLMVSQVKFEMGNNPASSSPAAPSLSRMNKTETGGAEAEGPTVKIGTAASGMPR